MKYIDMPQQCPVCGKILIEDFAGKMQCEKHCEFYRPSEAPKDKNYCSIIVIFLFEFQMVWHFSNNSISIEHYGQPFNDIMVVPWFDFPEIIDQNKLYQKVKMWITFS